MSTSVVGSRRVDRSFRTALCAAFLGLLAALSSVREAEAQQNLFNMPSGDITPEGVVFFQEQANFASLGESNTTFDFGLGQGREIGFNLLNVELYDSRSPSLEPANEQAAPGLLFNAQQGFEFGELFNLEVGTQTGLNPAQNAHDVRFLNFSWITTAVDAPGEWGKGFFGVYYANRPHRGDGDAFGYMLGVDVPIVKEKLHFMADYLSGTSDLSVAVVGGVIYLPGKWQLSLGGQIPSPGSDNSYGAVMELTQTDLLGFHAGRW